MSKYVFASISLAALVVLAGCIGTLQFGIEQTPTPDTSTAATIAALAADNARLATQVAALTTPATLTVSLGRLAFVQGGDIWVRALPDGRPVRLTTDGYGREPHWSPSGQWLAFRKEKPVLVDQEVPCDIPNPRTGTCSNRIVYTQRQLWVMEADGSSAHPLNPGDDVETFAWSPTDDRLAYVTAGGQLQAVNANGSNMNLLLPRPSPNRPALGQAGNISWSPDGAWIAYEWRIQSGDQPPTYQGIWKVPADGGDAVELYASGTPKKGEAVLAGWSPSGQSVLFWQAESRTVSSVDGITLYTVPASRSSASKADAPVQLGGETMLAYDDFVALGPAASGAKPQAVALTVGAGRSTWTNKHIEVGDKIVTPPDIAAISPTWSPDGTRLAYSAMPDHAELTTSDAAQPELMQRRIGVVSVAGDEPPHWITDSPAYRDERPLWSSDGSTILFARLDTKGRASLWIIPAGGGASRQVVEELTPAPDSFGRYGHVDWDGSYDWWRGLVPAPEPDQVAQPAPTPFPALTPYTNTLLHVSLQFPAAWQRVQGYQERFGDGSGFVQVMGLAGPEAQLGDACDRESKRKSQAYGSKPRIEKLQVQGQEVCLILPSDDQPKEMLGQASVVVPYPQPIQAGGQTYSYIIILADKDHIRQIARTIKLNS